MDNKQNSFEEEKLFDFTAVSDIFLRRRKIIIFSTSVLFSIFSINTLNDFFRNPIYQGSFSILIEDPIDTISTRSSSIEERLAANNTITELPTLIQYLKSQHVLRPLAEELGISSWGLRSKLNIVLGGNKPYVARGILRVSLSGKDKFKTKIILDKLSQRFVDAAKEQRQLRLRSGLEFLDAEYPIINQKTKVIKSKIENFRKKYNVVDPLLQAQLSEKNQNELKFSIKDMTSNIARLNNIKNDISTNKIAIDGYNQAFSDLGIKLTGSDQELLDKFFELQNNLASAKTKYIDDSLVVNDLKQRIKSLYPRIKEKQIEAIDLAIKLNNRKINIAKKNLEDIRIDFQLQPELINQYEELDRELNLSLENLNSLISAKENYQLQIAQKSLPWRVIDDPIVSATPISPNVKQDSIRNILLAFFISIGLALLKEFAEKSYTTESQVEKLADLAGIPLLGSIPFIKEISKINFLNQNEDDLTGLKDELSSNRFLCSESFRSLATSIRFLNLSDDLVNTILITSTKPSEGKTTITSFVAKTLADLGNRVLLIDGDMRRPSVHKFFGVDNIQGLSNIITDSKITFEDVILETSITNLEIITAGICPPDPVYLLSSNQMGKLFNTLSAMSYDYIIFDAPPSETLADANVLSQYIKLNLFVISLNKVERSSAQKVINKLSKVGNSQIGLVVNYLKEDDNLLNNYGYKYKYNNEIYKYYNKGDLENISEPRNKEKVRYNLAFFKEIIIKNYKKFKKWIDF